MKKNICALVSVIACIIISMTSVQPVTANASSYDLNKYIEDMYTLYNFIFNDMSNTNNNTNTNVNNVNNNVNEVNNNLNDVKKKVDSIDVDQSLDNYFSKIDVNDDTAASNVMIVPKAFGTITEILWGAITTGIISYQPETPLGSILGLTLKPDNSIYAAIVNLMRTLGYALVLVFFAINLIEQTIKFEIFTVKGMLQIFGRLILAKIIIDSSVTICMTILRACGYLSTEILKNNVFAVKGFIPDVKLSTSGIPIIGPIIDTIMSTILAVSMFIIIGAVMIATCLVIVKLILRAIELTLLVTVSPAFFACIATETTRPYFRNFILTFLQVSLQVVFMAIVLFVGSAHVFEEADSIEGFGALVAWMAKMLPNAILVIAMCIMMVRPPKVLTNLIK